MIYRNYILFDRVSLKKTYKTPLVMAEAFGLTCCSSVLCLKASSRTARKYITVLCQNSALTAAKNIKKSLLTAVLGPLICFFMFLPDEEVISQK